LVADDFDNREAREEGLASETISLRGNRELKELLGDFDCHLRRLRSDLGVKLYTKGQAVHIVGAPEDVRRAYSVIHDLLRIVRREGELKEQDVDERLAQEMEEMQQGVPVKGNELLPMVPNVNPRTPGQEEYLRAIAENDVTLCFCPAGTGKTFLSVAAAISHFKRGMVNRLVLTRPAVEAGESLGFLPGTLVEKVNPYLVPLFDALNDILGFDRARKMIERGVVEVAPLAFMRGRSLNHSFIILDEAQNTTYPQMKMFLTRMGRGSRAVVTGDITQIDLAKREDSGFVSALRVLKEFGPGVTTIELKHSDVVRNPIVQRIINAYDCFEGKERDPGGAE